MKKPTDLLAHQKGLMLMSVPLSEFPDPSRAHAAGRRRGWAEIPSHVPGRIQYRSMSREELKAEFFEIGGVYPHVESNLPFD